MSKILFVGDSITHGTNWANFIDFAEVINIAVPGFSTDDVKAQIDEVALLNPEIVSLLVGTNDFGNPEINRTGEDVGARVAEIIRLIADRLPHAELVINSILPRDIAFSDRIHCANSIISSQLNGRAKYLDCWPALSLENHLNPAYRLEDGFDVHLSEAGYKAWAQVLIPVLKSLL